MTYRVDAEIRQLRTDGGVYVNVLRDFEGGIGLWSHAYRHPHVLLIAGENWMIAAFDDDDWFHEQLPKLIKAWRPEHILTLPDLVPVIVEQ